MAKRIQENRSPGISDAAVKAATGKSWKEWFAILDRAGAAKMPHRDIAKLLHENDCGDWWSQMVAVGYERVRGLRVKHQKPDGYSISRSKTISAPVGRLFKAWKDKKAREQWLGVATLTIRKSTVNRSIRITWGDGPTDVIVMFYPKGTGKAQVTVEHNKLTSAKEGERMKRFWGAALTRLEKVLAS
ncbi:MAG: hypothetical protein HY287_14380 [Planctomycetes bacterium]|nr:hypothetical protein [Planctomycetota bacterium]MBI3835509.1 hypothetical protein [Planctomycetota bacterium]